MDPEAIQVEIHGLLQLIDCYYHMNHSKEAEKLVLGDRNDQYGNPREDYVKTAKIWSGMLSSKLTNEITPEEAILMMIGLKLSRLCFKHKDDTLIDLHGYALCYAWAQSGKKPE